MDFWVDFDRSVSFWPTSVRARRWLERNFDCRTELVSSREKAPMIERVLAAENFRLESEATSERQLDFDDQYSALLIAQATRQRGRWDEAIRKLVDLRNNVQVSIDPRSKTLLPQIEREINVTRQMAQAGWSAKTSGATVRVGSITRCIRRATGDVEHMVVRLALLVVLVGELYRFIAGR